MTQLSPIQTDPSIYVPDFNIVPLPILAVPLRVTFSSIIPSFFSLTLQISFSLAVKRSHGDPMSFQKPSYSTTFTSLAILSRASVSSYSPLIDFLIFASALKISELNR